MAAECQLAKDLFRPISLPLIPKKIQYPEDKWIEGKTGCLLAFVQNKKTIVFQSEMAQCTVEHAEMGKCHFCKQNRNPTDARIVFCRFLLQYPEKGIWFVPNH